MDMQSRHTAEIDGLKKQFDATQQEDKRLAKSELERKDRESIKKLVAMKDNYSSKMKTR